jgi:leucyl aminopeptidase
MRFKLSTDSLSTVSADLIAIPVHQDDLDASWAFRSIDKALDGRLAEAAREEGFRGGREKSISVNTGGRIDARRVFVVGLGTKSGDQMVALRIAAFKAAQEARRSAAKHVAIAIPRLPVSHTESAMENLAIGVVLGSYRYGEYKRPSKPFPTKEVTVVLRGAKARAAARAALDTGAFTGDCVNRARDLVNGPANDVTPTHLANVAKGIAAKHQGLKVKILNRKACEKLGMGLYLAVAQGSQAEPRFIHLTYTPPRGALGTLGLIGKGVTFDSGGLSLKPPKSMEDMKTDMAGGAAVISAMAAIARAKPPIRVHAVCAATERATCIPE